MYKYKRNRNEYEQWVKMNKNELRVQRYQGNDYKCLTTEERMSDCRKIAGVER